MRPSGRVGPVRVRGRQTSMFLLHPPSSIPPSHPFHQPFSPPHLIIIIISYSHFPSSSFFLQLLSSRSKTVYICKLSIFHKRNNLLHVFCSHVLHCVYIKYTYVSYFALKSYQTCVFCAFSYRLIVLSSKSYFYHNYFQSMFPCNYVLGIHSVHLSPFSNLATVFLCGTIHYVRLSWERRTEKESLQVLIKS